jgi:membrane fusion protein, multidrug efflux system
MKRIILLTLPIMMLAACGGKQNGKTDNLEQLKQQRADLDAKIKTLEGNKIDTTKTTPVSVVAVQPQDFHAYVEVQSQITGDENIVATSQSPGTVKSISVQVGQHVNKGQVLATLDASTVERQIEAAEPQLTLTKSIYEKQQALWKQNIGTEVQLMSAKANYEASEKQIEALKAQRDLYRVVAPISGTVDAVNLKVGEISSPMANGIRVVNYDKLKAEADLGENYLGKVKQNDPVILELPDISDSILTKLSYVSQAIDPTSRAFKVTVHLNNNNKLHPNMACKMKIANYESAHALIVPVSVIQKTSQGEMLYVADGNKARSVMVTTGRNANGQVEILSGLHAGDKVITKGYEEMDNGQSISIE